jgi:hypothetical protein
VNSVTDLRVLQYTGKLASGCTTGGLSVAFSSELVMGRSD